MLDLLGRAMYTGRKRVLIGAAVFMALAGAWGANAFADLAPGGFTYAASESSRAAEVERETLGRNDADVVVVFRSDRWTVDDPQFRQAVTTTLSALPAQRLEGVADFWRTQLPELVSEDRHATFATLQVAGETENDRLANYLALKEKLANPELQIAVGGPLAMFDDVNEQSKADLTKAEALALPVLFLLMVFIFRSLLAALLPVVIGLLAIVGSLAGLRLLTLATDVSIFAVNVVTLLGLGLAIDYSLFMVSRYREELAQGHEVPEALRRTMLTAGRTIVVSAVTVALALASLLVFPQVFLRSIGFGGIAAVVLAAFFSLTVMAALLAVLGNRLRGKARAENEQGWWARVARAVMRRPVLVATGVIAVLVVMGLPFLRIDYGWLDTRVLPEHASSRQAQEMVQEQFPAAVTRPVEAIVADPGDKEALAGYVSALERLDGVEAVVVTGMNADAARVSVHFAAEPISPEGRSLVEAVRAVPSPGGEVLVGGDAAGFADLMDMLEQRLPWMAAFVVLTTFLLLFLAFGSFILPIKAIIMNILSLSAAFGAVVWIFQDGRFTGLLGYTSTGNIDVVQPILILAVAFGLSMDYEVFLLSRIREQYDLSGDNAEAVALGLQRTGRIITSAALLLVVVILSFATSQVLVVKIIGIGLATAIVVDATIVRALLMPATMRLLGRANWWVPGPLRPLYQRWGIRERDVT